MTRVEFAFWLSLCEAVCWFVCFVWMHRISSKQNFLLDKLREQTERIEKLSKAEHDLIKEVHPKVGDIKAGVDEVVATVRGDMPRS